MARRKPPEQLRRRNAPKLWTVLPTECTTPAPSWPLAKASAQETALWKHLWRLPVAAWWHEQSVSPYVIARYVRMVVENPKLTAAGRLEEALGLTPAAMQKLRLVVERPEPPQARADPYAALKRKLGVAP